MLCISLLFGEQEEVAAAQKMGLLYARDLKCKLENKYFKLILRIGHTR